MAQLDLSQFALRRAILEVRYLGRFLIWDRAGQLWSEVRRKWPDLEIVDAQPNKTAFTLDSKTEASVLFDRANFVAYRPEKFDHFIEGSSKFTDIVNNCLDISEYTRIGLRIMYHKQFDDKDSASEAMLSLNLLKVPKPKQFNIDGRILYPEYLLRLEDDKRGALIRVKAEVENQEIKISPQFDQIKSAKIERFWLVYDIDYYTVSATSVGQFRARDWIAGAHHVIRRDSKTFLGG